MTETAPTTEHIEQPSPGLEGRFFHTWRDPRDDDGDHVTVRAGRVLERQGRVVSRVSGDSYLVEWFSWWDGCPNGQQLVTLEGMAGWTFYDNGVEMQAALGCRESERGARECGLPCEYVTAGMIGGSTVCARHATHYGLVQKIIWADGKASSLGPEIKLPRKGHV